MTTALRFLGKGWTITLEPNDRSGRLSYESGAEKVLRGAAWSSLPPDSRLTYRFKRPAGSFGYDITVRVLTPVE